jgi:hypothetical protein
VQARAGWVTLVEESIPYFNRAWDHFCSHRQTPNERTSGRPMIAQRGRVIYFASPIFHAYRIYGNNVYKALVRNALSILLPDPLVQAGLPSGGEATLLKQKSGPQGERLICHLLYYTPQRRAQQIDIVEDVVPLYDVTLAIKTGRKPGRVYLAPQKQEIPFTYTAGVVHCKTPVVKGHQIVVVE